MHCEKNEKQTTMHTFPSHLDRLIISLELTATSMLAQVDTAYRIEMKQCFGIQDVLERECFGLGWKNKTNFWIRNSTLSDVDGVMASIWGAQLAQSWRNGSRLTHSSSQLHEWRHRAFWDQNFWDWGGALGNHRTTWNHWAGDIQWSCSRENSIYDRCYDVKELEDIGRLYMLRCC